MALDRFGAEVFLLLKKHGLPLESVLTLGRQHFSVADDALATVPGLAELVSNSPELNETGERFAEPFFSLVGAKTIESLDASDYESCSKVHDLNRPIPEEWHAKYDVVFDGGTLEHVFHFPNAISNAMNLVKPGGVLVTQSPSNNLNGHGFYQFSPELFFRIFDAESGFRILLIALVESDGAGRIFRVEDPRSLGKRVTFGGRGSLQLITIAQREKIGEPLSETPYQSDYSASWTRPETADSGGRETSQAGAAKSVKRQLRSVMPASWVRVYDRVSRARRRRGMEGDGVAEVESLDSCFDRTALSLGEASEATALNSKV